MPPDGYDTVTLPNDLVQILNDLPGDSHTATVRMLVSDYRSNGSNDDGTPTDPEDIAEQFRRAFPYDDIDEMQETLGIISDRTTRIENAVEKGSHR